MSRDRHEHNHRNDRGRSRTPRFGDDQPDFSFPVRRQEQDDGEQVTGTVKWFNGTKGYGFIEVPGKKDAFLHASVLARAGIEHPSEGATIKCRVRFGEKSEVVSVEAVDESTAAPQPPRSPRPASGGRNEPSVVAEKVEATVKFFNATKGFGFMQGAEYDIFFHTSVVQRSGFDELQAGDVVLVDVGQGDKGRVAVRIHEAP